MNKFESGERCYHNANRNWCYLDRQESLADGAAGVEGLLVAVHVVGPMVIPDGKGPVGNGQRAQRALEAGGMPFLAQGNNVLRGREQAPQAKALPTTRAAVLVACAAHDDDGHTDQRV